MRLPFWWEHWRVVFGFAFWAGCVVGAGAGLAAGLSAHGLDDAIAVLTTETLLGVGLLATVLAALAILATFFDEHYRAALRELSGGFLEAVLPFRAVAFWGAVAATLGVASIAFWAPLGHGLRSVVYGVVTGATVCAVIGTWDLVRDTTFHGLKRDELLGDGRAADELWSRDRA
jgi:hypothetical protein